MNVKHMESKPRKIVLNLFPHLQLQKNLKKSVLHDIND